MKAASLWEPWATAMRLNAKRNETRGWYTAYRGPLLICAALRKMGEDEGEPEALEAMEKAGFIFVPHYGMSVAIMNLVDCVRTGALTIDEESLEFQLGNYGAGRWAWITEDCEPVCPPIRIRGAQGLFDVEWPPVARIETPKPAPVTAKPQPAAQLELFR